MTWILAELRDIWYTGWLKEENRWEKNKRSEIYVLERLRYNEFFLNQCSVIKERKNEINGEEIQEREDDRSH